MRVDGRGPAVLLESEPFLGANGAARVELAGAYTDQHQPAGSLILDAPERIAPLGMAKPGATYAAVYSAGPRLEVRVTYGDGGAGDEAGEVGEGIACPNPDPDPWAGACALAWRGNTRLIRLERSTAAPPATLVEQLPRGTGAALDLVVVEDARGALACPGTRDGPRTLAGETLTWRAGDPSTLGLTELTLDSGRLHMMVRDSEHAPEITTPGPDLAVMAVVAGAAVAAAAGAALAMRFRARRRPVELTQHAHDQPAGNQEDGAAPGGDAKLTQHDRDQLVERLEACATVKDPQTRAQIVSRLPDEIQRSIPHAPTLRAHVTSMVDTCARFPGGLRWLREAVHHFEADTYPMQQVDALLRRLGVLP